MTDLIIADIPIVQDAHGRYHLNSLHRASLAPEAKSPGQWLRRKTTQSLIDEFVSQNVNMHPDVVTGGNYPGTYVHELLAISYAGWISPAFQLKVNQAFIDAHHARHSPIAPSALDAYPEMRAIVQMAHAVAEQRQMIEALRDEQAAQREALIATQQQTIDTQQLALATAHGQYWVTIRQWVAMNRLEQQMPPKLQRQYAYFLREHCRQIGMPIYKTQTVDVAWEDERTYHADTIHQTLQRWLFAQYAQRNLELAPTDVQAMMPAEA